MERSLHCLEINKMQTSTGLTKACKILGIQESDLKLMQKQQEDNDLEMGTTPSQHNELHKSKLRKALRRLRNLAGHLDPHPEQQEMSKNSTMLCRECGKDLKQSNQLIQRGVQTHFGLSPQEDNESRMFSNVQCFNIDML